jgi:hypothetical protein
MPKINNFQSIYNNYTENNNIDGHMMEFNPNLINKIELLQKFIQPKQEEIILIKNYFQIKTLIIN